MSKIVNSNKARVTYGREDYLGAQAKNDVQEDQPKFSYFNGVSHPANTMGKEFKQAKSLAQMHLRGGINDFMDRFNNPQYNKA